MTIQISDPAASPVSPNTTPAVGSEYSPATASPSLFKWLGGPGRFAKEPAREPFDRLQWWTIRHELTRRLNPYQASDVSLMFRQASWGTLVMWSLLLDGIELEEPAKV